MGIWVLLQPREAGRGRKCTCAPFSCLEEPSKSPYSQRTTRLTSQGFPPVVTAVTELHRRCLVWPLHQRNATFAAACSGFRPFWAGCCHFSTRLSPWRRLSRSPAAPAKCGYHFYTKWRRDSAAQLSPIRGALQRCAPAQPQLRISAVQMVGSNLKLVSLCLLEITSSPAGTGPFPRSTPLKHWQHNSDSAGDNEMRLWEPLVWLHLDFLPCGSASVLEDTDCKNLWPSQYIQSSKRHNFAPHLYVQILQPFLCKPGILAHKHSLWKWVCTVNLLV